MQFDDLLYEVSDGRATITINRPKKLNAFRTETVEELATAFEAAADDESVGVVLFQGAGEKAFCVGGDIGSPTTTGAQKRHLMRTHQRLGVAMRENGMPIICRVQGWCVGGGHELHMLSDLTIASESARFGMAEAEIGAAALWWGCQYLPALVGEKKAREMLFLGRKYSAREALDMGLVNTVVADDQLDAECDKWCEDILKLSPQGLRAAKIGLNTITDQLYSSNSYGAEIETLNHLYGPEPKEGIASFQEKRHADWRKFREGAGPEPG